MIPRSNAAAFLLSLGLSMLIAIRGFGDPGESGEMQEFITQIEEVARVRARSHGFDPEGMDIEIYRRLRRGDEKYLRLKGVENLEGIWFVYFRPRRNGFGGDATFYFRYPEPTIIEEWLGE